MIGIDGEVRIRIMKDDFVYAETLHNMWTTYGEARVMRAIAGDNSSLIIDSTTINMTMPLFGIALVEPGGANTIAAVESHYVESQSILVSSLNTYFTVDKTIAYLHLIDFDFEEWSIVSTEITLPAYFTIEVIWRNTFSGEDYTSTFLNKLCLNLASFSPTNTELSPNSFSIIHSTGEAFTSISETIELEANAQSVVVFKGSFVTGEYSNIGTIRLRKDSTIYLESTITPALNKPSDAELHIVNRNTVVI